MKIELDVGLYSSKAFPIVRTSVLNVVIFYANIYWATLSHGKQKVFVLILGLLENKEAEQGPLWYHMACLFHILC